jgi:hypothetical protein
MEHVLINVYRVVPHVPCKKQLSRKLAFCSSGNTSLPPIAKDYPGYLSMIPTKVPTVWAVGTLIAVDFACKCLKSLAPQVGFEPTTLRLTAECSTVELLRNTGRATSIKAQLLPLRRTRCSGPDGLLRPAFRGAGSESRSLLWNRCGCLVLPGQ